MIDLEERLYELCRRYTGEFEDLEKEKDLLIEEYDVDEEYLEEIIREIKWLLT